MVRTIPAMLLGAGGAGVAIEYGEDVSSYFKEAVRAVTHYSTRPKDGKSLFSSSKENENTSAIAGELENLKRMLKENNRNQVVVVDKGGGGIVLGWRLWAIAAIGLGLGYVYIRYVKGWKILDLMYVSQATLKASTTALKQGIENLKELTDKTKEYLQGRLDIIESDQISHIEKTDRLDNKLVNLGETVDEMYTEVNEVHSQVKRVQGTLAEIQDAQQYSSQGIFLLLKVVGELVYHNDFKIKSKSELEYFARRQPPLLGNDTPGLEGFLRKASIDEPVMQEISSPTKMDTPGTLSHTTAKITKTMSFKESNVTDDSNTPKPFLFTRSMTSNKARLTDGAKVEGFGLEYLTKK